MPKGCTPERWNSFNCFCTVEGKKLQMQRNNKKEKKSWRFKKCIFSSLVRLVFFPCKLNLQPGDMPLLFNNLLKDANVLHGAESTGCG